MVHGTTLQKSLLLAMRLVVGWLFLAAGVRQIPNDSWSAQALLTNATSFQSFFNFLAQPPLINIIDALIPWVHLLLGIAFILGVFIRISALVGVSLMILYFLPRLVFSWGMPATITDHHLVYGLIMLYLASVDAGKIWGLQPWVDSKLGWLDEHPRLRSALS